MKRKFITVAFAVYCALMLWLLFGQRLGAEWHSGYFDVLRENTSLIPLKTTTKYVILILTSSNALLVRHSMVNLVGNVVMFIPLGYFLSELFVKARKYIVNLAFSAIIITAVETVQLFTLLGCCDIDDLLSNLIGTSIGYLFYKLFFKHKI